jgi:hypothetical protein
MEDRSKIQIVRAAIGVKRWMAKSPTTDEIRPARCPGCGAASREAGRSLTLWGHGRRIRQLRGPLDPDAPATTALVAVRRYLCRRCGRVCTVAPPEVVARRLFSRAAIALAVALFGVGRQPAAQVRRRVSPWRVVGATAARSWAMLRRWIGTVAANAGTGNGIFGTIGPVDGATLRERAAKLASVVAGHVPVSHCDAPLTHQAFHAGARMA